MTSKRPSPRSSLAPTIAARTVILSWGSVIITTVKADVVTKTVAGTSQRAILRHSISNLLVLDAVERQANLLLKIFLSLQSGHFTQWQHAVDQGRDRRHVIREHRRHDAKAHRERPRDAQSVGGDDQPPTPTDVAVEMA